MQTVAIDAGDFIRQGMSGSFRACTGVAVTIKSINKFNNAYSKSLEKACKKYKMTKKREVYKSFDILSALKLHQGTDLLNEVLDGVTEQISRITFYYTYIFTDKVPMIKLYGTERSGVEEIKPVEFIKKLSPSYPHCCAWKYSSDHDDEMNDSQLNLDHFEGEVTMGWEIIKNSNLQVFFAGDEMHPCLAVADILVKLLDLRLYKSRHTLMPEYIKKIFPTHKDVLEINYLGQKYLNFITPIKKQKIDVTPKLARPLIFIFKEQPPIQVKDESDMIRQSPLWNKICDFAYHKGGSVKFIDLNNKQDQELLQEGGFGICLGDKGLKTVEYLRNLGLPIEVLTPADLLGETKKK